MVHSQKPKLVKEIDFPQLVGELENILAVLRVQVPREAHKLFGEWLDSSAVRGQLAQRGHAQDIRHENVALAVPGVKEWAGGGQAFGFADVNRLVGGDVDPVLDHGIGPGDAHHVNLGEVSGKNPERASCYHYLVVIIPRFDLDQTADSLGVALVAHQLHFQPARGGTFFLKGQQLAVRAEPYQVQLAGIAQPSGAERGDAGCRTGREC